ncbi:MAG: HAMP domain-containing protein [Acidobacteria bacterium]|nr:MAG: HAMP domain-containing protein [Acidobacteriota bacterium]
MLGSLTNRIFLASALLAVLSILTAVVLVRASVVREAERGLQRGLQEASALVTEWQTSLSENFQVAARLIADAPPLKAAVSTDDPATVAPLVRDYRALIRATVCIVTDREGRVLAEAGGWRPDREEAGVAVARAVHGEELVSYWPHPNGLLLLVTVPIAAPPQIIGTLSVGFVFDRQRAQQVRQLTESEVALVLDGRVRASTLPESAAPAIGRLLAGTGASPIRIGDEEYVALVRPLAGTKPAPVAVVLHSRTERLRFLTTINAALGLTALVAVIVAIGLSYLVARTITRPLEAITRGMREVAATGDLTRKIALPAGNWEDEDARLLASTFNTLTDSIARFQREAAQRERLLSLGRMSTVIAHEIRNPLMIIKAALRPLRKARPAQEDVAEAAKDIGEEVDRLNRIVTEVLDLARPVPFELSATDLAALCRQAAAAATAGDPDPPVALAVPDHPLVVYTDGERVRAVLVNLLTNARHAVLAGRQDGRPDGERDGPEVELALVDCHDDRVAIEVRDRGTGIAAAHLGRVFEPYYTTRRGGTGLGLAIARNIVDGLGGRIAISSEEGAGTSVRIELPVTGPGDGKA